MKNPAIYIMANHKNGTIYTGVTSNLAKRVYEHKDGVIEGFTKKYGCKLLVFYEMHSTMEAAIMKEKQIKAGSRKKKLQLIEQINPEWRDLYEDIIKMDSHACQARHDGTGRSLLQNIACHCPPPLRGTKQSI